MSLQQLSNSSYLHTTSNIDDSYPSKLQFPDNNNDTQNQESDDEEINTLMKQIQDKQKQFMLMEQLYQNKIQELYHKLAEEDQKYKGLSNNLLELKKMTEEHQNRVLNLNQNQTEKSPMQKLMNRSSGKSQKQSKKQTKQEIRMETKGQCKDNSKNVNTSNQNSAKSISKKASSPSRYLYKMPMFHKASLNHNNDSMKDNISSDRLSKKSFEQKNSPGTKFKRNLKPNVPQQILKTKKLKGLAALKQKTPFK